MKRKEVSINYVCVGAWKLWENCQKVNATHNLIYIQTWNILNKGSNLVSYYWMAFIFNHWTAPMGN